jgi:uncharacterized protein (TIGR02996 family)
MTHANDFLQAILSQPGREIRLVYADWLEESGDLSRAEFVRLQDDLDGLDKADPFRAGLEKRRQELLTVHGPGWEKDDLFATAFALRPAPPRSQHPYRAPWLPPPRPDTLTLLGHTGGANTAEWLAASPRLAGLTCLCLAGNCLDVAGLRTLVRSRHLGRLSTLILRSNRLGDAGVRLLAACPPLATLTTLDLSGNALGADAVRTLLTSPHLANLTTLVLNNNPLGDAGLCVLLDSPRLAKLTTLVLSRCRITYRGAGVLASCQRTANLTVLRLDNNRVRDRGASALASSPYLARLTVLGLNNNQIREGAARALFTSPNLSRVTDLDLCGNGIGVVRSWLNERRQVRRKATGTEGRSGAHSHCGQGPAR